MDISAEILSALIVLFASIACITYILAAIKQPSQRGLNIIIALSCIWLSVVFLLNSCHIVINSGGMTGGRPGQSFC
jgi:hypothetical protein